MNVCRTPFRSQHAQHKNGRSLHESGSIFYEHTCSAETSPINSRVALFEAQMRRKSLKKNSPSPVLGLLNLSIFKGKDLSPQTSRTKLMSALCKQVAHAGWQLTNMTIMLMGKYCLQSIWLIKNNQWLIVGFHDANHASMWVELRSILAKICIKLISYSGTSGMKGKRERVSQQASGRAVSHVN